MLAQEHVVVTEEDRMGRRLGPPDEMHPVPNQGLPALVRRMRLAGDDELYGTLRIGQKTRKIAWGRASGRRIKCIQSRIRACPPWSAGCALPAMMSCTGR